MKRDFVKSRLLLVLVGLLTPTVVMALGHTYLFGCDACHTPHNIDALPGVPLWNSSETTTTFVMYSSDTFQGTADSQPSGDSRLCLACHDGSNSNYVWMNLHHSFDTAGLVSPHPVSFVYDSALAAQDGALKDPSEASTLGGTILEDLLDSESKVQCGSCHDVHSSSVGDSLLRGYDYGSQHGPELCRMCHMK
ncbi:MAG: cytochrome c3 family protein [Planctomycetota bacterium]